MRIRAMTAVAALALGAALMAGASSASAAQGGLAYDELTKFTRSDQPAPQPGTFTADFQAAVDAQKNAAGGTQHHGLFGSIMNAANAARGAMTMFTSGIPTRYFYFNGWERTEDPGAQTATINKPDSHQIIYLNLAKKTYRIVDTSVRPVAETPPPYQAPQNPQGPQPSPQPGTGKLDITVSSTSLGSKTIENVATTGYSQDFKLTSSASTGSCHDGSFETTMIEYLSSYAEPHLAPSPSMSHRPSGLMPMPMPAMMGVHPGCSPKTSMHVAGGASAPSGRLSLWTLVTLKGNAQTQQGQMGGGFSTLIERGNVHALGSSDAGLFAVPADYTKES